MWPVAESPESLWKFVGEAQWEKSDSVLYFILVDAIMWPRGLHSMHTCSIFFQNYGGIVFEQKYKPTMLRAQFSWAKAQSKRKIPATSKSQNCGSSHHVLYLHLAYTHKSIDNKRPCFKHKFHNSDPVSHLSSAITSQLSAKKTNPFHRGFGGS